MGTELCKKKKAKDLEDSINNLDSSEEIDIKKEKQDYLKIRIGLLGDSEVGKTSIIKSLIRKEFESDCLPTIGLDKFEKSQYLNKEKKEIKLIIWDTSGQERFRSVALKTIKNVEGIILVFDVTNKKSFDNIDEWISIIKKDFMNPIVILLGNKTDKNKQEWKVDQEDIESLANYVNWKYFEASAKNNEGIDDGFNYLVNKIYDSKIKNIIDN